MTWSVCRMHGHVVASVSASFKTSLRESRLSCCLPVQLIRDTKSLWKQLALHFHTVWSLLWNIFNMTPSTTKHELPVLWNPKEKSCSWWVLRCKKGGEIVFYLSWPLFPPSPDLLPPAWAFPPEAQPHPSFPSVCPLSVATSVERLSWWCF